MSWANACRARTVSSQRRLSASARRASAAWSPARFSALKVPGHGIVCETESPSPSCVAWSWRAVLRRLASTRRSGPGRPGPPCVPRPPPAPCRRFARRAGACAARSQRSGLRPAPPGRPPAKRQLTQERESRPRGTTEDKPTHAPPGSPVQQGTSQRQAGRAYGVARTEDSDEEERRSIRDGAHTHRVRCGGRGLDGDDGSDIGRQHGGPSGDTLRAAIAIRHTPARTGVRRPAVTQGCKSGGLSAGDKSAVAVGVEAHVGQNGEEEKERPTPESIWNAVWPSKTALASP